MQRIIKPFLTICLFLFATTIFAQNEEDSKSENDKTTKESMNFIKVNLFALALKNYSFQYERVLNRKFSFALGVRFSPESTLPFQNSLIKLSDDDPDAIEQIKNFKFGNTTITPELRFYVSKKGYGRGFYLAPFYRYAKYTGQGIQFTYENTAMVESKISMKGNLVSNTGGLMIGAQWGLSKRISLDWWIIGAHYGNGKGEFIGTPTVPLTLTEQNDLRQELENFEIPGTTKTVFVNATEAKVNLDGPMAGVKAGLSIGIRF